MIISIIFFIFVISIIWPEISFALFICAGAFKADPRFAPLADLIDPTILFFVSTAVGIVVQVIRKQLVITIPNRQLLVPYYIVAFMMVVGLLYTPAPIYGMEKAIRFILLSSFALFCPGILFNRSDSIPRFFSTFIFFALFFATLSIQSNWGASNVAFTTGLEGANYLSLGRISGVGALVCLFFYIMPSSRWETIVSALFACFLLIVGVLISGGRAPFISLILSIISTYFFIFFSPHKPINYQLIKYKLFYINTLISVFAISVYYRYADKFERIFSRLEQLSNSSSDESSFSRMQMISSAIDAITSFPTFFTGLGIGGFSDYFAKIDRVRGFYPHNIFLESAVELGVFALIAIIAWIFFSIKTINQMPESEFRTKITLFALLIFSFFNASISGDFNDNRLVYFTIGTILGLKRQ